MRYLLILFAFFVGHAALAQDSVNPREIHVTGEGTVSAVPDMATIMIGVAREARTASEAMTLTNEAASAVLARIEASGVEARDVQTSNIGLNPRYQHTNDGRPPRVTGYVATNDLSVRVRDLDTLGAILDAVVADGANQMNGLVFGIADRLALEDEARGKAVENARGKALVLAQAAGLLVGPVLSIREGAAQQGSVRAARIEMMDAGVPVAAGEIDIRETVSVVFAIVE